VDPGFQWRFAATISVAVFLASCIMGSVLYGVLHHQARMRLIHPETYTAQVTMVVLFASVVFAALTAGGVAVWCIGMTHRICGPLHVIQQGFHQMIDGRFPKLRPLRKKDEFNEFYRVFMQMVDTVKASRRKDLDALNDALESARTALHDLDDAHKLEFEAIVKKLEVVRDSTAEACGEETDTASCACASKCETTAREPAGVS
jgi:hypothetical protein